MERLTIQQLIDRCDQRLYREPGGTAIYQEYSSFRTYLQWLQHYQSLGIPFTQLRDLVEAHREDRLAIFPSGVGAPVWVIETNRKGAKVRATRINGFLYDGYQFEIWAAGCGGWYRLGLDAFMTKEAAERALRGGK